MNILSRRVRACALPALVVAAVCGVGLDALAHGARRTHRGEFAGVWFYGDERGCYWERGRRHCGSYCYWEVNGRRYCGRRERHAEPQGDPTYLPRRVEPPIYLRPTHRRPL